MKITIRKYIDKQLAYDVTIDNNYIKILEQNQSDHNKNNNVYETECSTLKKNKQKLIKCLNNLDNYNCKLVKELNQHNRDCLTINMYKTFWKIFYKKFHSIKLINTSRTISASFPVAI